MTESYGQNLAGKGLQNPVRWKNLIRMMFFYSTGSARQECLDHILILNERHLHHVLKEYVASYNGSRPHQGISQQTPIPRIEPNGKGVVVRRDVLGGIVYETYPRAEIHPDEVFPYYTKRIS